MRSDMSKIVVERPRYGHSDPNKKTKLRIKRYDPENEYDDSPSRMPSSKGRGTKNFTDVLGPLKKFLQSNVGRPWDKVYSELCQHLDRRKTTGRHVFQHLEGYVETACFMDKDGKVYAYTDNHGIQPANDFHKYHYSNNYVYYRKPKDFYVHPKTRVLCRIKSGPSAIKREDEICKERKTNERKAISVNQSYIRINGVWYIGDYAADENPPRNNSAQQSKLLLDYEKAQKELAEQGLSYWDGKRWMQLVSKRKCTQQELQKAGLKNANKKKQK